MESMLLSSIILDDLLDYPKLSIGRCDLCLGFFFYYLLEQTLQRYSVLSMLSEAWCASMFFLYNFCPRTRPLSLLIQMQLAWNCCF